MNPLLKIGIFSKVCLRSLEAYAKIRKGIFQKAPQERYNEICREWSTSIFNDLGYELECTGEKPTQEPCIYLGNHVSFLDIPLVWTSATGSYVSKKEIRYWPIIGMGAAALGTIFVDRSSVTSRAKVLDRLKEEILQNGKRICIYPEGTSSVEGTPWKWGAFRLAQENNITVQPFRLYYEPLRDTAYMGDDTLAIQFWKMLESPQRLASIEWGKAQKITDYKKDAEAMEKWVRESFEKRRSLQKT